MVLLFFFFKQKTAYEIGTGDWSSDVCSSDLKFSFHRLEHIRHDEHGDHLMLYAPNGEKKIYYKGGGKDRKSVV